MKKNDLKELLGLSIVELEKKSKELIKQIEELTFDKNMKKLKDVKSITKKKQDLARVLTVKRQKEMLEELEVGSNIQETKKTSEKETKKKEKK